MREWVRRLDKWKQKENIVGEATVLRWWKEWPNAGFEILQADYTVEEFESAIPDIQKFVDDKRAGIEAPRPPMPRAERLATFVRASAPILLAN